MAYDDNTAIIALKNGEEKALTWIYNKYIQLLRSHALNVVGCIKTAEDIVHDLFLILWEKRKNIHINVSLNAYLHKGVYNHCLKHLEHIKIANKHVQRITDNNTLFPLQDDNNPLSMLIQKETESRINNAIDALPKPYREVFVLVRLEEFSYDKVAEKMNIPLGSVGPLINRASKKLRKLLENT